MIDAWGDQPAPTKPDIEPPPMPFVPPDQHIPGVRIGDRVRVTEGDVFTAEGAEGCVVNTVPPRPSGWAHGAARVLFDDECIAIISAHRFQVIERKAVA